MRGRRYSNKKIIIILVREYRNTCMKKKKKKAFAQYLIAHLIHRRQISRSAPHFRHWIALWTLSKCIWVAVLMQANWHLLDGWILNINKTPMILFGFVYSGSCVYVTWVFVYICAIDYMYMCDGQWVSERTTTCGPIALRTSWISYVKDGVAVLYRLEPIFVPVFMCFNVVFHRWRHLPIWNSWIWQNQLSRGCQTKSMVLTHFDWESKQRMNIIFAVLLFLQ